MVVSLSAISGYGPMAMYKKFFPCRIFQIKLSVLLLLQVTISGSRLQSNPPQHAFSNCSRGEFCLSPSFGASLLQNSRQVKLVPVKRRISWLVIVGVIIFVFSLCQTTISQCRFIIEFCINISLVCRFCNWIVW